MKKKTTYSLNILFLLFIESLFFSPIWAIEFDQRSTQQWAYEEYSLAYSSFSGNPFDVLAKVTFTHSDGIEVRETEMFYDGNDIWKFRLTPTQAGTYTFTTQSTISELNGHTGSLEVIPNPNSNVRGFLTVNNNRWVWQANQQVIIPNYVMWGGNGAEVGKLREFQDTDIVNNMIAEFVGVHGFTGFHTNVMARGWFNIDQTGQSLVASETNPDTRSFTALENLINRTYQAGGHIHIWAWGDQSRGQTPLNISSSAGGGLNGIIDKRLQRYISARLGPIPGWSMGYGFDLDEWDGNAAGGHAWRSFMQNQSGWFHFYGGRPVGPNNGISGSHTAFNSWNSSYDYSSYEHHLGSHSNEEVYQVFVSAIDALPGQPVFSEDRTRLGSRSKDVTVEQTRDFHWAAAMAGGVASIWGDRDSGIDLPSRSYSNKQQLKTYSRFFRDNQRLVVDMLRSNSLSADPNTKILHSPSKDNYVLYRENANSIQVDLSAESNSLPAIAVDTLQPYSEIDLGNLSNTNQTITLPNISNWAVAIGSFASGGTRSPRVILVNSTNDSGDGSITDLEVVEVSITQLRVTFDQDVANPAGNSAANDVTNPANYLLSEGGTNSTTDTMNCSIGIAADDTAIRINSVTYNSATEIATLNINGATPLPGGNYRLLVCGTTSIENSFGDKLDGNGDGVGGDDFIRNFSILDTDDDGIPNGEDSDDDNDDIPDDWEITNGTDSLVDDAAADPDNDGASNLQEFMNSTNPLNGDTDNDGMSDGFEISNMLDPLTNDAANDPDNDNLTNLQEFELSTDPRNPDTDGDSTNDDVDNCPTMNNPDQADTDNDGIGDVCDTAADEDICVPIHTSNNKVIVVCL